MGEGGKKWRRSKEGFGGVKNNRRSKKREEGGEGGGGEVEWEGFGTERRNRMEGEAGEGREVAGRVGKERRNRKREGAGEGWVGWDRTSRIAGGKETSTGASAGRRRKKSAKGI